MTAEQANDLMSRIYTIFEYRRVLWYEKFDPISDYDHMQRIKTSLSNIDALENLRPVAKDDDVVTTEEGGTDPELSSVNIISAMDGIAILNSILSINEIGPAFNSKTKDGNITTLGSLLNSKKRITFVNTEDSTNAIIYNTKFTDIITNLYKKDKNGQTCALTSNIILDIQIINYIYMMTDGGLYKNENYYNQYTGWNVANVNTGYLTKLDNPNDVEHPYYKFGFIVETDTMPSADDLDPEATQDQINAYLKIFTNKIFYYTGPTSGDLVHETYYWFVKNDFDNYVMEEVTNPIPQSKLLQIDYINALLKDIGGNIITYVKSFVEENAFIYGETLDNEKFQNISIAFDYYLIDYFVQLMEWENKLFDDLFEFYKKIPSENRTRDNQHAQYNYAPGMHASCNNACVGLCYGSCVGTCNGCGSCTSYCDVACGDTCTHTCQTTSDNGTCHGSCYDECVGGCALTCSEECRDSCSTGCMKACTTACKGACGTTCTNACNNKCITSCITGCKDSCNDSCGSSCEGSATAKTPPPTTEPKNEVVEDKTPRKITNPVAGGRGSDYSGPGGTAVANYDKVSISYNEATGQYESRTYNTMDVYHGDQGLSK